MPWNRCQFHLSKNAQEYARRKEDKPRIAQAMRDIFNAPSREDAEELKDKVVKKFEKIAPEFVRWLEENVDEGLTVFDYPRSWWKRIRTINGLERLNREIRRRTRVVGIFPHEASALRLISAVLAEIHEEWLTGRRSSSPSRGLAMVSFSAPLASETTSNAVSAMPNYTTHLQEQLLAREKFGVRSREIAAEPLSAPPHTNIQSCRVWARAKTDLGRLAQAGSWFCPTRNNPVMTIQRNIKISIDRHREKGGRLHVSKTPGFSALLSGFLWSGNNSGPPRSVTVNRDPFRYPCFRETFEFRSLFHRSIESPVLGQHCLIICP